MFVFMLSTTCQLTYTLAQRLSSFLYNMVTYSYSIASIRAKNPQLPDVLGDVNINEMVVEGQALDHQHLKDGNDMASAL